MSWPSSRLITISFHPTYGMLPIEREKSTEKMSGGMMGILFN